MNLGVNPDLLARSADDVSALRDSVRNIFDDLQSDLASRGNAWEHGRFGAALAGGAHGYLAAKDHLFESAQNLSTTLDDYSSAITKAADAWAAADSESPATIGDT
jgi:uncharacterized protein YukE